MLVSLWCCCVYSQETFESGLSSFEGEGVGGLTSLKDKLVGGGHPQERQIKERHSTVMAK